MGILDYIVLKDGLPIYCKNVDPVNGISQDETKFTLVSGFLSAISSFVDQMNNLGQVDEIQMSSENYFFFQRTMIEKHELLFIVVSNHATSKDQAKFLLQSVTTRFLDQFMNNLTRNWDGNIQRFKKFDSIFNTILDESTQMKIESLEEQKMQNQPSNTRIKTSLTRIGKMGLYSRFNRYRILKNYQTQFRSVESPFANIICTDEGLPWASKESWDSQGDINESSEDHQDGETEIKIDENNPVQNAMINDYEMQQMNMRTSISAALRSPATNTVPKRSFCVSQFEKIPAKEHIPASILQNLINSPWKKTIYKSINGNASIRELANNLGVSPSEILATCQELLQYGVISLKQ